VQVGLSNLDLLCARFLHSQFVVEVSDYAGDYHKNDCARRDDNNQDCKVVSVFCDDYVLVLNLNYLTYLNTSWVNHDCIINLVLLFIDNFKIKCGDVWIDAILSIIDHLNFLDVDSL